MIKFNGIIFIVILCICCNLLEKLPNLRQVHESLKEWAELFYVYDSAFDHMLLLIFDQELVYSLLEFKNRPIIFFKIVLLLMFFTLDLLFYGSCPCQFWKFVIGFFGSLWHFNLTESINLLWIILSIPNKLAFKKLQFLFCFSDALDWSLYTETRI